MIIGSIVNVMPAVNSMPASRDAVAAKAQPPARNAWNNGAGSLPGNGQYLGKNGTFSSYHPGGCHFALADGSARFLSQDIDQLTLQSLAGRNDGAIVEGY